MDINMDARTVRGSLDHLVKLGWLVSYQRQGSGVVYGLNRDRREKLRKFLEGAADLR
jgi:DNA-binding GntR family transcriptional regulator